MPFVFIVLGLIFLVVAVRGTQATMFSLLKSEFVGTNSFVPWVAAILILGFIGYAKPIRPISDAMIGLILFVILVVNHGNVFAQFNSALSHPVAPPAPDTATTAGGLALQQGSTLSGATADADAAAGAQQPNATPSPTPDTASTPWYYHIFGSPAY